MSDDATMYSRNLRGPSTALKQTTFEGTKVGWMMVLTRGVMHVEVMGEDWHVDGTHMASFVRRLPRVLKEMLGTDARLPRTVFTDRGTGMYTPLGRLVGAYEAALADEGFHPYWGNDASAQAADMPDLLLHETAVALFRARMRKEAPQGLPWQETREAWAARARRVVRCINRNCDLQSLCREFPARLEACVASGGDRLRK